MREAFESMHYIVLSFIDLNSSDYLRAIRFLRDICESADRVSVMVYVAGHGYRYNHEDFLIPVDACKLIHHNNHDVRYDQMFSLSSLNNLLENFISEDSRDKYNVIVLWDLCRADW